MNEISAVLTDCLRHILASEDSAYSAMSARVLAETLQNTIAKLERDEPIDKAELRLLFAPTGDLQETSIDNGWGDEFVALSARFDRAI